MKDLDLALFKITEPSDVLIPDTIIDVPDDATDLIKRLKMNGNYEIVVERPKTKKVSKKDKKEDDD